MVAKQQCIILQIISVGRDKKGPLENRHGCTRQNCQPDTGITLSCNRLPPSRSHWKGVSQLAYMIRQEGKERWRYKDQGVLFALIMI